MSRSGPRDRAVYRVKWCIANLLYWSGLLRLLSRFRLRHAAVVLAYHRVLPADSETWSHPGIIVTPTTFDMHLQLLRRYFRLLTLDEFVSHLATAHSFETASCLVTFDDGWFDTYEVAWPQLETQGVPAAVFLATSFVGTADTFWQERLGRCLGRVSERLRRRELEEARVTETLATCGLGALVPAVRGGDRQAIIAGVRSLKGAAGFDPFEAISLLSSLGEVHTAIGLDRFMTWEDARRLAADGRVRLGGHGHRHAIMTALSAEELAADLAVCREMIEGCAGANPQAMSYPNGNWNAAVRDAAGAAGFAVAFTMDSGSVSHGDHPRTVRRVNIHEGITDTPALFLARVLGVL